MKTLPITLLAATALLGSCTDESADVLKPTDPHTLGPGAADAGAGAAAPAASSDQIAGTVAETMDAGGYTYVQIDTGGQLLWAAGPETALAVGDEVRAIALTPMPGFSSPTLDRTFEMIYFAGALVTANADAGTLLPNEGGLGVAAGHAAPPPSPAGALDVGELTKAEGGQTVGEVFAAREDLVGTEVAVRGVVVKYTAGVLGKNWLHVQDGTGTEGADDLTVTTDATAAVGDTVLLRGILAADRDFGFGYQYDLLVEDAQVTVE